MCLQTETYGCETSQETEEFSPQLEMKRKDFNPSEQMFLKPRHVFKLYISLSSVFGGCISGAEPGSCYQKVAGSTPLVLVCLGKILNPELLLVCWFCMAATTISV